MLDPFDKELYGKMFNQAIRDAPLPSEVRERILPGDYGCVFNDKGEFIDHTGLDEPERVPIS
jgi:hypothetical protein